MQVRSPQVRAHIKWLEGRIKQDPNFIREKGKIDWWIRRTADFIALPIIMRGLYKEWTNPEFQAVRHTHRMLRQRASAMTDPLGMAALGHMQQDPGF